MPDIDPQAAEVAAAALTLIEKANALAGGDAGSAMGQFDPSVAGLPPFDPVLTETGLKDLKDKLAAERITANAIAALWPLIKQMAMALAAA